MNRYFLIHSSASSNDLQHEPLGMLPVAQVAAQPLAGSLWNTQVARGIKRVQNKPIVTYFKTFDQLHFNGFFIEMIGYG